MVYRNRSDVTLAQWAIGLLARARARAQLRRELDSTSDRALAELGLGRGDVDDVVAGTYRRAA